MREQCDALCREKDKLPHLESIMKMMLEEPFKHSRSLLDTDPRKRYSEIRA
jgi:hypothetical protein